MGDLNELKRLALEFRDQRDWAKFHKPKDVALSLLLEAAELAEHFQWKDETEVAAHVEARRGEIADELSDVLYWVLIMANDAGINLGQAFQDKLRKNAQKYPVEKAKGRHSKYSEL